MGMVISQVLSKILRGYGQRDVVYDGAQQQQQPQQSLVLKILTWSKTASIVFIFLLAKRTSPLSNTRTHLPRCRGVGHKCGAVFGYTSAIIGALSCFPRATKHNVLAPNFYGVRVSVIQVHAVQSVLWDAACVLRNDIVKEPAVPSAHAWTLFTFLVLV